MSQIKAARRGRGKQRAPLQSTWTTDRGYVKSSHQKFRYNATLKVKRRDVKFAGLVAEFAKLGALHEQELKAVASAKRKWNAPGAPHTALRIALEMTKQCYYTLTLKNIDKMRRVENPQPYEQVSIPEKTSIQRALKTLTLGAMQFLRPKSDKLKVVFPLRNFLEELIDATDFEAKGGVAADENGVYDMTDAPSLDLAISVDGAELLKKGTGFLCMAYKPFNPWIARQLAGLGVAEKDQEYFVGQQSPMACCAGGWMGAPDDTDNNMDLASVTLRELVGMKDIPFVHSRTNIAYNVRPAAPQDLKSIQTLTGCGGGSSSCKQFCTFCPQHSELRGQPSLKRCPCCLVNDPGQEFECHHHAFLGGSDFAGALPTQTARESAQEVCASSRSLLVATSGLLNMSTALSKAAKKAVGAARAADLTTFPARARAPLALQALHSVEAAVAASVELLAAVARAQASVSAEARLASDGGITPLIVGPVSQTAVTDTTAFRFRWLI
mmetsp:Transcript_31091/g.68550  ORF Transcript_31091/g.68550 Transcript_31091/m.68550 type:complete len:497 (-) Transcript_31091:95-1585(-)